VHIILAVHASAVRATDSARLEALAILLLTHRVLATTTTFFVQMQLLNLLRSCDQPLQLLRPDIIPQFFVGRSIDTVDTATSEGVAGLTIL
jgi:hypothetical protein